MTLTEQEQAQVERRVNNSGKSVFLSYFLWLFVGLIGVHRFYNKQNKLGFLTIMLCIAGIVALFIPVHTQMPEYTQCVQSSMRSYAPSTENTCQPQVSNLSSAGKASMLSGTALIFALFIWWLVDAFLIPRTVRKNNQELRLKFQDEVLKQRPPQDN